jgi:hypothetical protein
VDIATATGAALAALGLAGAAGLNAWLPLLATGFASRGGHLELGGSFDVLGEVPVLAVLALLFAVDFVGDKIPAVDHALHAVGSVVHPLAGAVVAAAQAGADVPEPLLAAAGAVVALSIHAERSALRPFATVLTGGIGNPVLSLVEDAGSLGLAVLAIAAPLLAVVAVLALAAGGIALLIHLRRRHRARRRARATSDPG